MSASEEIARPSGDPLSGSDDRRLVTIFLLIAPLYLSFGALLGFLQAGLPVILRSEGQTVENVAWVFLLYLPIGLSFLWASNVDRYSVPGVTGRRGWIMAMQGASALLLLVVASMAGVAPSALFAVGFVVVIAVATMDVALEAFVVEAMPADRRPAAAALKIATACVGGVLGGGVLVLTYPALGWSGTFVALSALLLLSIAPIACKPGMGSKSEVARSRPAGLLPALKQRTMRRRILLLLLASGAVGGAFGLNRIALVDFGIDLETIGLVTGTIAPFAGAAAAAIAGPLVALFGRRKFLLWLSVPSLVTIAAMIAAAIWPSVGSWVPIAASILGFAIACAFAVVLGSVIIAWSKGSQAGTDFALQYGLSNTAATLALFLAAQWAATLGWAIYLAIAGSAFLLVLVVFDPLSHRFGLAADETQ